MDWVSLCFANFRELAAFDCVDKLILAPNKSNQIGLLSALPALWLQGNQLSGAVPQELFSLAEGGLLADLNLTGNPLLSGFVPENVCLLDMIFDFDCTPTLCGCACDCAGMLGNGTGK